MPHVIVGLPWILKFQVPLAASQLARETVMALKKPEPVIEAPVSAVRVKEDTVSESKLMFGNGAGSKSSPEPAVSRKPFTVAVAFLHPSTMSSQPESPNPVIFNCQPAT